MILAAAVCPCPPALVPEVAQGAAPDLADLRNSCDAAVAELLGHEPKRVVVIGSGLTGVLDETAGGSLAPYGLDVSAGSGRGLPLAHTIGAWLLDRAGWSGARTYTSAPVPADDRDVLLVMADGTAKRSTSAPGYFDERAEGFDDAIAQALRSGDAEALSALDVDLGAELWASGTPALRVLGDMAKGATITAQLRSEMAPFGVGYWVANWTIG